MGRRTPSERPEMSIATSDLWNLASAVIGGVIGALAGGIPAWLIARRQAKETSERDRDARLHQQKAAGHQVFVKLLTIVNSIYALHRHIEDSIASAEREGFGHMEIWQRVEPMVGFSDEGSMRFDAEEAALFLAAKQGEYLMDLLLLGWRHGTLIATFKEYLTRRDAYRSIAPVPDTYKGTVGSAQITGDELRRLRMHTIPLESMITALRAHCAADWELAKKVARGFGGILQTYFNDPTYPALTVPEEGPAAQSTAESPAV